MGCNIIFRKEKVDRELEAAAVQQNIKKMSSLIRFVPCLWEIGKTWNWENMKINNFFFISLKNTEKCLHV